MLHNINYWWFFLSQGNRWIKYHKYGGQNIACWCLCLWSFWTAFTCCCPLSWLPIWLRSEVVDPCFIQYHIFTQNLLFVALKQLQTTLNCWHIFDRLWANVVATLNTAFSLTNVHAKCWIHCLPISSTPLLSYTTSIFNRPNEFVEFFGVFQDNCQIWATRVFSIICVWLCLKSAYHLLTVVFDDLLEQYFSPHQKVMLYQHTKFKYFHCF